MNDIILNPVLEGYIKAYLKDPVQGLLINGPKGAGKGYIANYIAYGYPGTTKDRIHIIEPLEDKKVIGIDQIKIVISRLRTKQDKRLFVIIEDAEKLTPDAQNALLKILEEPPNNVSFILTTSRYNSIFPTIKSRVTKWEWIPPEPKQIKEYTKAYNIDNVSNYNAIARGRMGLIHAILTEQGSHPLVLAIDSAKDMLAAPLKTRLLKVDELTKDAEARNIFIEALALIAQAALDASALKGNQRDWLIRTQAINDAINQLDKNIQPKLVLTRLFLVL
jgi:hypothetical protein